MRSLLLACALVCAASATSWAKTALTHDALWLMKRVSSPAVSPDGKWVVAAVVEPAYSEADQISDLWLIRADNSEAPRRLTATKTPESGAAWAPDSRRIAFSARRDGDDVTQIYVIDLAGGEAVRITSVSTGATAPRWSPDGKSLLFTSMVYPGAADEEANKKAAAERRARRYRARVYDSFPIRYWDKWLDDTQPHLLVQAAQPGARSRDLLAGSKLVLEPGFAGTNSMSGQELLAAWTPDGRSIVFAATTKRNAAAYATVKNELYQASLDGGDIKQLTNDDYSYARPVFRPDGKALYALFTSEKGGYSLDRLAMFPWPNPAERTVVTKALDRSVDTFAFSPDNATVYLTAEDHGHMNVYSVPANGGEVRTVLHAKQGMFTALTSARTSPVLTATWESAVNPPEVVRIDPASGRHTRLTSFAAEQAAALEWEPLQEFTFTSTRGKKIHSFVALPPGFDSNKKYPLFVLIHGGPHNMWRDQITLRWNYHLLAKPGYVVLMTNYTGSTGFGEKFAQEIKGDPLKGPADEINEAADEAIKRFAFIDATRQAAGGASYGGHLANWLQATTTRYKCLISHAGLINLESQWGTSDTIYHRETTMGGPIWEQGAVWREQNPIRFAKNFKTPILLTVGENDYRVPINQTLENWSVLQRLRVPSRLIVFPNANHWITNGEDSRFFYQEVHAWLAKWLGAAAR